MGRKRTSFGYCTAPGCPAGAAVKGLCMACYQKRRNEAKAGECQNGGTHYPVEKTITLTPSGTKIAQCARCKKGYRIPPTS